MDRRESIKTLLLGGLSVPLIRQNESFMSINPSANQKAFDNIKNRAELYRKENQPIADLGNGYYRNPVISVGYGDVTVARKEDEIYIVYTKDNNIQTFRSKDLVNWEPVSQYILPINTGTVWAPDLQYFNGKFYLYLPVLPPKKGNIVPDFTSMVTTSVDPAKGWSELIDLKIDGIDPGVIVTPAGKKYIYTNKGRVAPLSEDGLKITGPQKTVYKGWQYPFDWNVQCFCLEGPKLFYREGYFYLLSAQGGTGGPSTAHMSVIAKSKFPTGPWENSPYNPLIHTFAIEEKWWRQGHGDIIDLLDGSWWMLYSGFLRNFPEMGKYTLLLPISWTKDGWPVVKDSLKADDIIPKPKGENIGHGLPLSDNFNERMLGMQWTPDAKEFKTGNGELKTSARGKNSNEATKFSVNATNISYEVSVEVKCPHGATAGLIVMSNPHHGLTTDGRIAYFTNAPEWRAANSAIPLKNKGRIFLKIRNYRKDISLFCSDDGLNWKNFGKGIREEHSYNIALYAAGNGLVTFKNFRYFGFE